MSLGEFGTVAINLALGGGAAFVAWGRTKKVPIEVRRPLVAQTVGS